ncbi:unnamed protein product [Soboliphyme baturini]|uniref:Core-2/I-Branching enzyme n=1 Tax=Soboliphyme baturini TaxID=241478 RepID=A0A183J4W7_9BILA|nr:unnamed protein product [Soboliphyme baturini]
MTAFESYELFANCSKVLQRHYYPTVSRSPTEAAFPLGYVVLLNEHLEQVEIAFNSIYAPQNFYCYQIDLKAPHVIYAAMERLSHCFPNVVVSRRPFSLTRASEHNLEKTKMTKWRYLIILETHDFPLRNNEEIVRILDLYNDQNDVELTHDIPSRTKYIFEPSFDELGMHNGYSEVSLSRAFVNSIRKHPAFWSTLTHDENLQLPGSYPGRCLQTNNRKTFLTRFTIWQWDKYPCRGYWRNSICVFSSADLPFLVNRPELFANKFWLPEDPISVDCLHELLYNRTYLTDGITSFNIDAYANTSAVLYRNKVNAVFACPGIID